MALRLSQFYLFSFENDDTQLPLFLPKSFFVQHALCFCWHRNGTQASYRKCLLSQQKYFQIKYFIPSPFPCQRQETIPSLHSKHGKRETQ